MLLDVASWLPYVISTLALIHLIHIFSHSGLGGLFKCVGSFLVGLPGVGVVVKAFTKREVDGFMSDAFEKDTTAKARVIDIPEKGIPITELEEELHALKSSDGTKVEDGRLFAYVYTTEGPRMELQKEAFKMFTEMTLSDVKDDHADIVKAYVEMFMHDNALNPMVFPSLRKFENEVVSMTASMLNGDHRVVGSVTSGGTESILMAMKTHRDRARHLKPKITQPNVIAPSSIHPAFEKAAHYFNLTIKHVPVNNRTFICDVAEYEEQIDSNTILLLASAPSYPQGILDPVEEISRVALRHKLPFHVDACFGGFMLPWVEKLGKRIPKWDFRLQGVTSITADLHKYGFATKGASVVCYRHSEIRKYQFFAYSGWSGGLFVSPTMAGTRPGGHLAAAWAALRAMGQDGYMQMATRLMETVDMMKSGIRSIEGLQVLGEPLMSAFAFASCDKRVNIFGVADVMEKKVISSPENFHLIESYNLNTLLGWHAPDGICKDENGFETYDGNVVRYIFYWQGYDEGSESWSWRTMPDCVNITHRYCRILQTSNPPYESTEFKVVAKIGSLSSEESVVYSFSPYYDGFLRAPNFTVTFNKSKAVIRMTPLYAYWSDVLLLDALFDEDLHYKVQYWLKDDSTRSNATVVSHSLEVSDIVEIPVKARNGQMICFQVDLVGITGWSSGWSDPLCTKAYRTSGIINDQLTTENNSYLSFATALLGILGVVAFAIILVFTVKLSSQFIDHLKARDDRAIPLSLLRVISHHSNNDELYTSEQMVSCPADPITSNLTLDEHENEECLSNGVKNESVDFQHYAPSPTLNQYQTKLDFVTNETNRSSSDLISVTSNDLAKNSEPALFQLKNRDKIHARSFDSLTGSATPSGMYEITDYIVAPVSPDSGFEMPGNFHS